MPPIRSAKLTPAPPDFGRTCPSIVDEIFGLGIEPRCGELDQTLARGRRRLADLHAAALDAVRAGGAALIGRQRGVALDELDLVDPDAELLGGDLRERNAQALAEIDLAGKDRDRAVAVDRKESVDLLRVERSRGGSGGALRARRRAGR